MNILNFALGGLAGSSASPLALATGLPGTSLFSSGSAGAANAASPLAARDGLISDLPDISSMVNLLQQAAGSQNAGSPTSASQPVDSSVSSQAPLLNLPPLPPMPQPQQPAAVPTDDHGQSNIVFSDADNDGALIH